MVTAQETYEAIKAKQRRGQALTAEESQQLRSASQEIYRARQVKTEQERIAKQQAEYKKAQQQAKKQQKIKDRLERYKELKKKEATKHTEVVVISEYPYKTGAKVLGGLTEAEQKELARIAPEVEKAIKQAKAQAKKQQPEYTKLDAGVRSIELTDKEKKKIEKKNPHNKKTHPIQYREWNNKYIGEALQSKRLETAIKNIADSDLSNKIREIVSKDPSLALKGMSYLSGIDYMLQYEPDVEFKPAGEYGWAIYKKGIPQIDYTYAGTMEELMQRRPIVESFPKYVAERTFPKLLKRIENEKQYNTLLSITKSVAGNPELLTYDVIEALDKGISDEILMNFGSTKDDINQARYLLASKSAVIGQYGYNPEFRQMFNIPAAQVKTITANIPENYFKGVVSKSRKAKESDLVAQIKSEVGDKIDVDVEDEKIKLTKIGDVARNIQERLASVLINIGVKEAYAAPLLHKWKINKDGNLSWQEEISGKTYTYVLEKPDQSGVYKKGWLITPEGKKELHNPSQPCGAGGECAIESLEFLNGIDRINEIGGWDKAVATITSENKIGGDSTWLKDRKISSKEDGGMPDLSFREYHTGDAYNIADNKGKQTLVVLGTST